MTRRADVVEPIAPDVVRQAAGELQRLQTFADGLGIPPGPDAILLYLTELLREQHLNGSQLRRRLRLLDTAYILEGQPAPSRDRHMRAYLRGLHQEAALGPIDDRTPLYREDLVAMLDAIGSDNLKQLRDVALLYVANATGMTANALRHLTWHDVRLRKDRVEIRVPLGARYYGPRGTLTLPLAEHDLLAASLRNLRRGTGPKPGPLFAVLDEHPPTLEVLKPVLDLLPARRGSWSWSTAEQEPEVDLADRARQLLEWRPRQRRDAALLSLAYHACLESSEATALRRRDLRSVDDGLLVYVPGRRKPTAIPATGRPYDAGRLWQSWDAHLRDLGRGPDAWAFPAIVNHVVIASGSRVSQGELTRIVQHWTSAAWLQGHHTFASLRMGFMRTAARNGVPEYMILNQAGLSMLKSVELHVRREHLIRHSVVNLLGL